MRKIITVLIIVCALFEISNSQQRRYGYVDYHLDTISVNNVTGIINNYGSLEQWPGIRWKDEDIFGMVFDQGLWVIGKYNEEVRIAFSQWRSSYSPGPVINEKAALLVNAEDSSRYKVYKLGKNDINKNYEKHTWPSDLGAPANAYGYPELYNDQMLWSVYNSANDTVYANHWMNRNSIMKPIPLEIHQITHARNTQDANPVLDDVLFFEWEVINKGSVSLDSAFIGFWTDIDSFNYSDTVDRPAIDTVNQLGYCWSNVDPNYSCTTIGYVLLYGPVVSTESNGATFRGEEIINHKNLSLNSFHPVGDDSWGGNVAAPAASIMEAWNYAQGLDRDGSPYIDLRNGDTTKFPFAGNPEYKEGWLFNYSCGGGAGFAFFTGPVDLAPKDTQWIMIALIAAAGETTSQSIINLKSKAATLRSMSYDELVMKSSYKPVEEALPVEYKLYQNYPNPFNPTTTIEYTIPNTVISNGVRNLKDFSSQAPRNDMVNVKLKVYDILGREVKALINNPMQPGRHKVEFDASGLASGVYFYQLIAGDYIQTKKLVLLR